MLLGMVDLVYLPVQQYREDGRIVRGIQRGANSFTHSTAVSLLQLTTKLFSSIQCVAEVCYMTLKFPIMDRYVLFLDSWLWDLIFD